MDRQSLVFGTLLGGRYRIERPLGAGAMGSVYEAVQEGLGRKVAIKVLHGNLAFDTDAITRFQREAQAAAALGHPNIVQVIDFQWPQNEPPFLVMENLTGESFADAIKKSGRLDPLRAIRIARQIASALEVAHAAGIIHRDIKPDNVFLVQVPGVGEVAKVLDFGIAKLDRRTDGQQTADGTMLGSPAYMAPEQARGGTVDARSDVFALGSTLYRALSGQLPFDAPSLNALVFAIAEQTPAPLMQLVPGLDPRIAQLVDRAMQKNPAARFQSAADMRAAIDAITQGASYAATAVSVAPAGPSPYSPSQPAGPRPSMAMTNAQSAPAKSGGAGVIIALLGVIVLLLLIGGGVAGFLFYRASASAVANVTPMTSGGATTPSNPASPAATDPAAPNQPGALIPAGKGRANNMHDAGNLSPVTPGGPVGPAGAVDAGVGPQPAPTSGPRVVYSGKTPSISGGQFGDFPMDSARAMLETRMAFVRNCYESLQTTGPDHQFTDYRFRVSKDGKIMALLGGPMGATAPRIPSLDACIGRAFIGVNVGKSEKAQDGDMIVAITARSPGNE